MSLTAAALYKISKHEIIALTLQYQSKFDSTLAKIANLILEGCNQNCLYLGRLSQNFVIEWQVWNGNVGLTTNTPDEHA